MNSQQCCPLCLTCQCRPGKLQACQCKPQKFEACFRPDLMFSSCLQLQVAALRRLIWDTQSTLDCSCSMGWVWGLLPWHMATLQAQVGPCTAACSDECCQTWAIYEI